MKCSHTERNRSMKFTDMANSIMKTFEIKPVIRTAAAALTAACISSMILPVPGTSICAFASEAAGTLSQNSETGNFNTDTNSDTNSDTSEKDPDSAKIADAEYKLLKVFKEKTGDLTTSDFCTYDYDKDGNMKPSLWSAMKMTSVPLRVLSILSPISP